MGRCPDCGVRPIVDFTNSFECSNCGREFDRDGVQIPNHLYPDTCAICGANPTTTNCNNANCDN